MYEYKVLSLTLREMEKTLNQYAKEGWRLAAQSLNISVGVVVGAVVTLERKVTE
nr:DUF4177 domain-containing protein [uncultured Oscillibacter sp.]